MADEVRLYAVFGYPVAHSLSPRLHNHAFRQEGMACYYVPVAVKPEELAVKLEAFYTVGGRGVNLTRPLKETVLPLLAGASSWVQATGAANTLRWSEAGWVGDNTDVQALVTRIGPWAESHRGQRVLVLGAGGAARATVAGFRHLGLRPVVAARRPERVTFAEEAIAWEAAPLAGPWAAVVNATPLGQRGESPLTLEVPLEAGQTLVVDWVYVPRTTALLARARALGCPTVDGLELLVLQARHAWQHWFGRLGPESLAEAVADLDHA
ncbi:MAG: shikimate dehydrogenase [Firmicutes bacterium]|nr:shikimate dehydrogenase [Alicyclobacillaceae bacterium]MCL6496655.1 shikimate dehydrogenase [Bacillota bacterium]